MSVPDAHLALHADAVRLLSGWRAPGAEQERRRLEFLRHLAAEPGATWRSGPSAHLTASCVVLDVSLTRVLLTLHRRAGLWLQFGGHHEHRDRTIHGAATREAREESGIVGLQVLPAVVDLDRHALGDGFSACTEHLDVRFAAVAAAGAEPTVSEESHDVRWWPVRALPEPTSPDLARAVRAGVELASRLASPPAQVSPR